MNKNNVLAIFILFAILLTCAGTAFAGDIDDSYMDEDLNLDLDDNLDEDLNDEDSDYNLDDEDSDDYQDDEDLDDKDWDEDSDDYQDDEDLDDEDWDEDSDDYQDDEDSDEEDWDEDSDDYQDDEDLDDDEWDDEDDSYYDLDDEDWDEDYWDDEEDWDDDSDEDNWDDEEDWDDDFDEEYWKEHDNVTYTKKGSFMENGVRYYYALTYFASGSAIGCCYAESGSANEEYENTTSDIAYHLNDQNNEDNEIDELSQKSQNNNIAQKNIKIDAIKDNLALAQSQTNKTSENISSQDINLYETIENNNIFAVLAMLIVCILLIL